MPGANAFILSVGLGLRLSFAFAFFSFFFLAACASEGTKFTIHVLFRYCLRTIHGTTVTLFIKKNIKNRFHDTIYTFKNYFTTVFLVFSFQFQQK